MNLRRDDNFLFSMGFTVLNQFIFVDDFKFAGAQGRGGGGAAIKLLTVKSPTRN